MKKKMKTPTHKIVACILCIAMILTLVPESAIAVEDVVAIANEEVYQETQEMSGETQEVSEEPVEEEAIIVDETLSIEEQANAYLESAPTVMTRSVGIPDTTIGGVNNPFKISSAAALQELATLVSEGATYSIYSYADACYELTHDIDLGDTAWTAIEGFNGSFNGNNSDEGYTITSSVIQVAVATEDDQVGLFAIGTGNITDVKINYTGSTTGTTPSGDTWASYIGDVTGLTNNEISTAEELAYFASQVNAGNITSGTYTLTADIDLSAHEWVAIGDEDFNFTATFDGGNHNISGLYIDNALSEQGMFGYLGSSGVVENLHITGSIAGSSYVGGVVGYSRGSVNNCSFSGSVAGVGYVGGIVGYAMFSGSIKNCSFSGSVEGTGSSNVGGIVGCIYSSSTVSNCYNTGTVSGTRSSNVGGIIGKSLGTVSNCYNTGTISGTSTYVGGIVGYYDKGTVTNCVSLAHSVTGTGNVGRVSGSDGNSAISNNYAWSGTTLTGGTLYSDVDIDSNSGLEINSKDGSHLYYSTTNGFTTEEGDTTTTFEWEALGFTTANGWTIPTDTTYQLPYLTDVSQDIPQNPLVNLLMISVTFVDGTGETNVISEETTSLTIEVDDVPTDDIWGSVDATTGEFTSITWPQTYTEDAILTVAKASVTSGSGETETTKNYATLEEAVAAAESGATITLLADCTTDKDFTLASGVILELDGHEFTLNSTMNISGTVSIAEVTVGENGAIVVTGNLDDNARIGVTNTIGNIGSVSGDYTVSNSNFFVVDNEEDNKVSYSDGDKITDVTVTDETLRVADFIYKEDVTVMGSDDGGNDALVEADMWFEVLPSDTSTTLEAANNPITTDNYKNAGYYILAEDYTSDLTVQSSIYLHLNGCEVSGTNMILNRGKTLTVFDEAVSGGTISSDISLREYSTLQLFGGTVSGNVSGEEDALSSNNQVLLMLGTFTGTLGEKMKMYLGGAAVLGTSEEPYSYDGNTIYYYYIGIYGLTEDAKLYIDLLGAENNDHLSENLEYSDVGDDSIFLKVCTFTNDIFDKSYLGPTILLEGMNVDETNKIIYANAYNLGILDGDEEETSTVYWDKIEDGKYKADDDIVIKENADLSDWTIYGGGTESNYGNAYANTILIQGGNVGTIYTGGANNMYTLDTTVKVMVDGECSTDIYMINDEDNSKKAISTLNIYSGTFTGEIITVSETNETNLSVGGQGQDAAVTIVDGHYFTSVTNYTNGTINWNGGVVSELYVQDSSTVNTNLNYDLSNQTVKVFLIDSNGKEITSLTKAIKFLTLGESGAYGTNTFSLNYHDDDLTIEMTDSQVIQLGSDLYYAPSFSASIKLADDAQYESETTATVTLSNQDLGEGLIASKATIYAVGENGTDVEVGEITVENGTTVYKNVEIDLTDKNISVDSSLNVQLYVEFDLVDNVTTTATTTKTDAQMLVLNKKALDFTVDGTEYIYDGTDKSVTITGTGSSLTADDFTITYYKETGSGTLYTTATTPKEAGSYLYVISASDSTDYNETYYSLGTTYTKPTDEAGALKPNPESYNNIGYMTISKSGIDFGEDDLTVDDEDSTYTYGEIITITVTPELTGVEPVASNSVMVMSSYDTAPAENQMALFDENGTQLCKAVDANANGSYVLTYDTTDRLLAVGTHTITAKYMGNDSVADYSGTFEIKIEATVIDDLAISGTYSNVYNGSNQTFKDIVLTSDDILSGDEVSITIDYTTNNANAGDYTVSGTVEISGTDAGYYTLNCETITGNVTITAKELTVKPDSDQGKYYGEADGTFRYGYTGNVTGETPSFTGTLAREIGENIADYGITAGNLQLADNGAFLADNYKLIFDTTVNYSITQKSITEEVEELTGWISADTVTLTAPTGYTISLTNGEADTFTSFVTVNTEQKEKAEVTYYLRDENGAISIAKTFTYSNDQGAPTGEIKIGENKFKTFINGITFGMFFKNNVDVTITGEDTLSGVDTIEYQKVATEADYSKNGTWIKDRNFSVGENQTFIVYARITDKVGNATIINSEGVVIYTDSEAKTTNITFTKLSTTDVTADVTTNGNTILGIKNGENTLTKGTDYLVSEESNNITRITFKASYLDTLSSGDYTFNISYNPLGEAYVDVSSDSVAPLETTIALTVSPKAVTDLTVKLSETTKVYDGTALKPAVTVYDGETEVSSSCYTVTYSEEVTVGTKEVKIEFSEPYTGTLKEYVEITNASITVNAIDTQSTTYNGTSQSPIAPTGTTVNGQTLTVKYMDGNGDFSLTSIPSYKNAGKYSIYYEMTADNHETVHGQITFTIDKVQLTWNTNGTVEDKVYDGRTDATVYIRPTLNGVISGDKTPEITSCKVVFESADVGTYKITVSEFTIEESTNYEAPVEQPVFADASITAKEVIVTPKSDQFKYYGEEDPDFLGFDEVRDVNGESLEFTGKLSRTEGEVIADNYVIEIGTLACKSANYYITFTEGVTFAITQYTTDAEIEDLPEWSNTEEIKLVPPTGYDISISNALNGNTWSSSYYTATATEGEDVTYTYYLKSSTGAISQEKTVTHSNDQGAPTGEITIGLNKFKSFINEITFGMFFKEKVDVTITGEDTLSGVDTIAYQKVATEADYSEDGTWITGSKFSVEENQTFIVYARITDKAGNATIINSDGVVIYTDSEAKTTDIAFTKLSTTDVTADVRTNGNTIHAIKNGEDTLTKGTDYFVSEESNNITRITFKASYLDTLSSGDYTFTISYNPQGEAYVDVSSDSVAPLDTTIALKVSSKAVSGLEVKLSETTKVYDGTALKPAVTVYDDGTEVSSSYYTVTYSEEVTVGTKEVKIEFSEPYTGTLTKYVEITNASIIVNVIDEQSTTYNSESQSPIAPTGTTVTGQTLTVKYKDGNGDFSFTPIPSYEDSGEYYVYYKITADNHETVEDKITFTIAKATPTITASIEGWTYGGTASTPNFTTSSEGTDVTYAYSDSENGTYTSEVPCNAGIYYMKATVAETSNFTSATSEAVSFEIKQKALTATIAKVAGFMPMKFYDGTTLFENLSLDLVGVLEADTNQVIATATGNSADADANMSETGYVFTATSVDFVDATGNYSLSIDDVSGNVSIQQISTDIKLEIAQSEYIIGEDVVLQATTTTKDVMSNDYVSGTVTFYDADDTIIGTATIDTTTGIATYTYKPSLGTYKVRIVFEPDDSTNYSDANHGTLTFDVVKKANEVVFSNPSAEFTYGETVSFEASVTSGEEVTIEYKQEGAADSTYTSEVPTAVGTYVVRASVVEGGEYFGATATYDFKITKASNAIHDLKIDSWFYGGVASTPSATADFGEIEYTYCDSQDGIYTSEVPTNIGTYYVKASVEGTDNYDGATSEAVEFDITYAEAASGSYSVTEGWDYESIITAANGYTISTSPTGTYGSTIKISEESATTAGTEVTFYIKNEADGTIGEETVTCYVDQGNPMIDVSMNDNVLKQILNTLTLNIFFKNTVDVKITATDSLSGVEVVKYQVVTDETPYDSADGWIEGTQFSVKANTQFELYIMAQDYAGSGVICTIDSVTVYTDSVAVTKSFDFVKSGEDTDKEVEVTLNGNTVAGITLDETDLISGTDYTVGGSEIIFAADYLTTLSRGEHVFTISYNPMGMDNSQAEDFSDVPSTTTVTAHIYEVITDNTDVTQETEYNGESQSPDVPTATVVGDEQLSIAYSEDKGETYTLDTIPSFKDAGTYQIYYELSADDHVSAKGVITFVIDPISLTWSSGTVEDKIYDGTTTVTIVTAPTLVGVVEGDTAPVITVGSVNFESKNAGTHAVTATGYKVADDTNYVAPTTEPIFAEASITAKEFTVTPESNQGKYYGEADGTFLYGYTGNVTDETPSFTGTLARATGESIGDYEITVGDLALADYGTFLASNYKFVFDAATVNYSITQKDITAQVTEPATWISADEVELVAPTGYTISLTNGVTDTFTSSVIVDTEEKEGVVVTYYLREADGAISTAKTFTYGNDQTAPTGEITIGENKFKSFINGITFGMFFKEKVDVTITGEDALSGVDTIEYQKVATEADYSEGGTWITASKFSVEENETFIVYARITDKVGNATIINSDGVVVYTDSEAKTTEIAFTKLGTEDVTAEVTTNGNTILGITNGTYTLTSDDYLVSMESNNVTTITFKASYLDTLTSGDYTFTISYNPLGETYVVIAGNEAPAETTIALTVNKRPLSVVIDNQEIVRGMSIPTFTSTVSGNVNGDVIEVVYSTDADNMTAGTYEIFMANTDDYPNYDIDVTPGILTVTNGYTVSFDGEEITDIAHGETVAEPENPTKDGYIFLGWYAGDEEFDFTTAITGDLELTSAWEEVVEKEDDTDVEDDPDVEDDTDVEDDDIVDTSDTNNVTFTFSVMLISLLAIALLSKKKFEVK